MNRNLDRPRILVYLTFAFGIACATSLFIYLSGGLVDSPMLLLELNVSLVLLLRAGPVMWSPAIARVLTRMVTREGWERTFLRPG